MQLTLASKTQKAKMFLDGRDLDQSDAFGKQEVKSIVLAKPNIFIAIKMFGLASTMLFTSCLPKASD